MYHSAGELLVCRASTRQRDWFSDDSIPLLVLLRSVPISTESLSDWVEVIGTLDVVSGKRVPR